MESFYGGRPGASFIITKTFPDIATMKEKFSQGTGYNEVYYDEYVVIQTSNPENADNGKVFRRGYDLNNGYGGGEYVGSIKGPAGPPTVLELMPYKNILSERNGEGNANTNPIYGNYPTQNEVVNNITYHHWDRQQGTVEDSPIELIPGKSGNKFNNNIFYRYYQITDANNNITKTKMGFRVPYPIFDFSVTPINADQELSINKVNANDNNKFYHNWNIKIPIARKGDSIQCLRVITIETDADNENINYEYFAPGAPLEQQQKRLSDRELHQAILTCDIVTYNAQNIVDTVTTYYICDFNIIKNINITQQGYLQFTLPDGNIVTSSVSILPSINNMELNEYGQFSINWENTNGTSGESVFDNEIQWINNIEYTNDGFKFIYNTRARDENGEIIYENGQPKRASKIIPIGDSQKVITDIKFFDKTNVSYVNGEQSPNDLYYTYVGIESDLQKVNLEDATYSKDLNPFQGYVRNSDGIAYKKILGFKDSITNIASASALNIWNIKMESLQKRLQQIENTLKSFSIVTNVDNDVSIYTPENMICKSKLYIDFHSTSASEVSISLNVPLASPIVAMLHSLLSQSWSGGTLQDGSYCISQIQGVHTLNYSQLGLLFNKIYLSEIPETTLDMLYPNELFGTLSATNKLNKWQNIYASDINTNKRKETDYLNQMYAFYRGYGGYIVSNSVTIPENSTIEDISIAPNEAVSYIPAQARYGNIIRQDVQSASTLAHSLLINQAAPFFNKNVTSVLNDPDTTDNYSSEYYANALADSEKAKYTSTLCNEANDYIVDLLLSCLTGKDYTIPQDGDGPAVYGDQNSEQNLKRFAALANWNILWYPGNTQLSCSRTYLCYQTACGLSDLAKWDKLQRKFEIPVTVELNLSNLANIANKN